MRAAESPPSRITCKAPRPTSSHAKDPVFRVQRAASRWTWPLSARLSERHRLGKWAYPVTLSPDGQFVGRLGRWAVQWKLPAQLSWVWKDLRASCVLVTVQSLSRVRLFATPWTAARQGSLSITNSRSLLKLRGRSNQI